MLGVTALGLALGAIVVGQLLLVPLVAGQTQLVDANLARALAEPLARRSAEVTLGACLVLAACVPRWLNHRLGTSLALIATGIAALDRLVVLPRVHAAWQRVDLVAMRPVERLAPARELTRMHHGALAAALIVLVAVIGLLCHRGDERSTSR